MKRFINLMIALVATVVVTAAPVTRQDAKKIAAEFMAQHGMKLSTMPMTHRAPRKNVASQDDYYYIFNSEDGKGYVIISGDDSTEQVLGYSDEGAFDANNIPESMQAWLDWYAKAIQIVEENNAQPGASPAKAPRKISSAKRAISPLLKSKWNQGGPYNILVPFTVDDNGNLTTSHCATGCVATALAQVMYYHRWPEKTIARIPSHTTIGEQKIPYLKLGTPIKWDLMQDTYDGTHNTPQDTAVAELMLYVGQALKMGYGPSSGAGHGHNVPELLKKYFDYDDGGWCASRGDYTLEEWEDLLYSELDENRPVSGSGGGHAYVVDGYDGNGLFHVNWGWGGSSDGYFLIDIMNPGDGRGIGAGTVDGGYPVGNMMINIKPNDGVEGREYPRPSFLWTKVSESNVETSVVNWTGDPTYIVTGLAYQDQDGELVILGSTKRNLHNENILYNYSFPTTGLRRGTWKLTPVTRVESDPTWHPHFNLETKWVEATVIRPGQVELTMHDPVDGLSVDSVYVTGSLRRNDRQYVNVKFSETMEEFQGDIHIFTCYVDEEGSEMEKVNTTYVSCDNQFSRTFAFPFTPEKAGNYNIYVATDGDGNNIIGEGKVKIYSTSYNNNQLSFTSLTLSTGSQGGYIYGPSAIGKVIVKNTDSNNAFKGVVKVTLWHAPDPNVNSYWTNGSSSQELYIEPSNSGEMEFRFDNLIKGHRYGFSVDNITQGTNIRGLYGYGNVTDGVLLYTADGKATGRQPTEKLIVRNSIYAVDLRDAPAVKTIDDRANDNTIYFIAEGADIPAGIEGKNIVVGDKAENITIIDEQPFVNIIDFTADHITYKRTISKTSDGKNAWEGISLPFEPNTISADGQLLKLKTSDNGDGQLALKTFAYIDDDREVKFDDADRIEAIIPYVISAPESDFNVAGKELLFEADNAMVYNNFDKFSALGTRAYTFFGTTMPVELADAYTINDEGTAFEPVSNTTVNPFRTYFTTRLSEAKRAEKIFIADNEETGIKEVRAAVNDGTAEVYDLQGRRMNAATLKKGIYIVNGKKTVVK